MVRIIIIINNSLSCSLEETNCAEGEVRLMGGAFETEGRVEVCHNGIWGSICSTGFDATDAHVVCKEVGIGPSGMKRF